MRPPPASPGQAGRRAWRSESGNATIEFVILFPVFVLIFLSIFELSLLMGRQTLLDRAVDLSVRSLRLDEIAPLTAATLKDDICENAPYLSGCTEALRLELKPVSTETWDIDTSAPSCSDDGEIERGAEDQLMLVRACIRVDPIFPTTGLALHLPTESGSYGLISTTAFVNEPE